MPHTLKPNSHVDGHFEGATLMTPSEALENCDDCRIEVSTSGIVIDNTSGDLMMELGVLFFICVLGLFVYAGYRWIKTK